MVTYYLSNGGSDSSSGTSPPTAWATIAKFNTVAAAGSIAPGDSVLFRRGDLFYGSPEVSGHFPYSTAGWLTYGAYGAGAKPRITCYKVASNTAGWANMGNDVWRINLAAGSGAYTGATGGAGTDIGHIRVNGVVYGRKRDSLAALADQWDFYSGDYQQTDVNDFAYVKSAGNPASNGTVVEIAVTGGVFNVARHRTEIRDLELFGADFGIEGNSYWSPHDVLIHDCDIHEMGGAYLYGYQVPTRGGNGIQAWIGNKDWLIEHNRVWEIYDVAITYQGDQGVQVPGNQTFERLHARRNTVWNSSQSVELWGHGTTGAGFIDCSFTDNLCFNAGSGWGFGVRPDPVGRGCHILIYDNELPFDVTLERNVFFGASTNYIFALDGIPVDMKLRNNVVYLAPGTLIQDSLKPAGRRSETVEQFAAFVAATGRESGTTWFSSRPLAERYLATMRGRLFPTVAGMKHVPRAAVWPAAT